MNSPTTSHTKDEAVERGLYAFTDAIRTEAEWGMSVEEMLAMLDDETRCRLKVGILAALRSTAPAPEDAFLTAYASRDGKVTGIDHPTEATWEEVMAAHIGLRDWLNTRIAEQAKCPFAPAPGTITAREMRDRLLEGLKRDSAPAPEEDAMPYEAGGGAYRSAEPRAGFTRRTAPAPADQGVERLRETLRALPVSAVNATLSEQSLDMILAAVANHTASLQAKNTALEGLLWRAMDDASIEPADWYAEARALLNQHKDGGR